MTPQMLFKKMLLCLAIVALLFSSAQTALAVDGANPGILPPNAHIEGKSLAGWSAKLFQAIVTTPLPGNPFYAPDPNHHCAYQLDGHMALLWTYVFATEPYSCSVPPGTMLVVGVAGVFADNQDPTPCIDVDMSECVNALYDLGGPVNYSGSIDGKALTHLEQYLVDDVSGSYLAPANNIFGYPVGTPVEWAIKGVNIIIAPLPVGEHTLHFQAEFQGFGISTDNTLIITVKQ